TVVSASPPVANNAAPAAPINPQPENKVIQEAPQANPEPAQQPVPVAPPAQADAGPVKEPIPVAPPGRAGAGGVHEALPLKELKAATVFVRVETPTLLGSGSGFVVHAQGATVYVATNHHVISPPTDREQANSPPSHPSQRAPGM